MRAGVLRFLRSESFIHDAAHVFLLAFLALAYPVLDLLARNAEFFIARRSDRHEILFLVAVTVGAVPLVLLVPQWLARLGGARARRGTHLVTVGLLAAVLALPVINHLTHLPMVFAVVIALVVGGAAAVAYSRSVGSRVVLTLLSPLPIVYVAWLLLSSPVAPLVDAGLQPRALGLKATHPWPVVVFVLDEFAEGSMMTPDHQVDRARLPNLGAFADTATWYRNATSVHEATEEAVPALLSGKEPNPKGHPLPVAASYPVNLFTSLGDSHLMHVNESLTQLCPAQICGRAAVPPVSRGERNRSLLEDVSVVYLHTIAAPDLAKKLPDISTGWGGFVNRRTAKNNTKDTALQATFSSLQPRQGPLVDKVTKELRTDPRCCKPALYYTHLYLPHRPWRYLPSGKEYGETGVFLDDPRKDPVEEENRSRSALQRHLLQVGYLDRQLGRVFDAMRANHSFDESMIILTADHGAAFGPGMPLRIVSEKNLAEISAVPMMIKYPGQKVPAVDDRHARTIDLLPTILDVLGMPKPGAVNGLSLRSAPEQFASRKLIMHTRDNNPNTHGKDLIITSNDAGRDVAIKRIRDDFGTPRGGLDLYSVGKYRRLSGEAAPANPPDATKDGYGAVVNGLDRFADVKLDSAIVPSHVTGQVTTPAQATDPLNLAFALNGRIVATTTTNAPHKGRTEFDVILPDTALRAGRNDMQVLLATGDVAHPTLRAFNAQAVAGFRVETKAGATRLVRSDGQAFPVVADAGVTGGYERANVEPANYTVVGYAADLKGGRLVDRVVVCVDTTCVFSGVTSVERPAIAHRYKNEDLRNSGFEVRMPSTVPFAKVAVYAVLDGKAQQLRVVSNSG